MLIKNDSETDNSESENRKPLNSVFNRYMIYQIHVPIYLSLLTPITLCDNMTKHVVLARVTDTDSAFIDKNYPIFKLKFPDLTFEDFIGVVINAGVEVLKTKHGYSKE